MGTAAGAKPRREVRCPEQADPWGPRCSAVAGLRNEWSRGCYRFARNVLKPGVMRATQLALRLPKIRPVRSWRVSFAARERSKTRFKKLHSVDPGITSYSHSFIVYLVIYLVRFFLSNILFIFKVDLAFHDLLEIENLYKIFVQCAE